MSLDPERPKFDPQLFDAGMFPDHPDLRRRLREGKPPSLYTAKGKLPRFLDQTDLVKFVEMVVSDPSLSEGLEPLPMDVYTFQKAATDSEAVQLDDGTWMKPETISAAWYADESTALLLPEVMIADRALSEQKATALMAAAKPREITQWWLVHDNELLKTMQSKQLVTVESADSRSVWVGTYDEELKDDFWKTSIGFCLEAIINGTVWR